MKILQVITSLQTGGAEKLIVDIVPLLRQRGLEVDVCIFNGKDTPFKRQLEECGGKIYCLSHDERYYSPIKIYKLWRIMRHYDIVHTHNTAPQLFAAIAGLFCAVKLITTEHNTYNRRRDWIGYKTIDRWMYDKYCKVICISKQAEENLREYLSHSKADIVTIYNGVDVDRYYTAKADISLCNLPKRFAIVMVAGFREQKDQDTLIRAMSHLDKEKFEIWLVGDGERHIAIEGLIRNLNLEGSVRLLGWRQNVAELLHAADVVVMSSHWEGFGLVAVEGMAAYKPVLASDVDGLNAIVRGYGILFPHGDDKALANEIKHLAEDRDYYNQIASQCYERAKQFDIRKMVDAYANVYEEL